MIKSKSVAILFSGGTDSTLTAALLTKEFNIIHLITYNRFGFHETDNTEAQAKALQKKYPNHKFIHVFINVDKLFEHISYENYFSNLKEFGLFNLSTCGLCKLSMHVRTIIYCLDNNILEVADGANQAMTMEPAQMKPVIDKLRGMYKHFNLNYFNPVFEMEGPSDPGFIEKSNLQLIQAKHDYSVPLFEEKNTPGQKLYELGLAPAPNVKGSDYDKKRQPRCFQFILFNIFALKYFMEKYDYETYTRLTTEFYTEKINRMIKLLENKSDQKIKKIIE